ncbi:MAG TPA: hypothetical protein VGG19_15855 [Tepidisphaeraceae bacterium]|jgi:hypothetical protein
MRYAWAILLSALLVGCTETRTYRVVVKNATPDALTIGLTGAEPDHVWNSPEEIAISNPQANEHGWGQIVPPGKTADTTVKGKFQSHDPAFCRVYANGPAAHLDFSQLLAISRGAPNRVDLHLFPGLNVFIVRYDHGILDGERMDRSGP